MKCSICGQDGHNKRTCQRNIPSEGKTRDRATILRVDNMTQEEQDKMHMGLVKLKKKVTSNDAKATLVEGSSRELPSKIKALIDDQEKNDE